MKNTMTLIVLAMMSSSLLANEKSSKGERCEETLKAEAVKRTEAKNAGSAQPPLTECEKYNILSIMNRQELSDSSSQATIDGKIPCKLDGGYTSDYKDCKNVMKLYNGVIMAEQAMFATQKIIISENNIKQNKDIAAATAKGDLQYGAIEAVTARNELNEKMYKTQAYTYSGAVSALSIGLSTWGGKKSLVRRCKDKNMIKDVNTETEKLLYPEFNAASCDAITNLLKDRQIVFANENSKARYIAELATLIQKAAEANRLAGISADVAERLKDIPKSEDVNTTVFDPCMTNTNGIECKKNGPRNIKGGAFAAGQNNFGTGTGTNQDFNFDPNGPAGIGSDPLVKGTDPEKVGDVASPFEKAAKEASGILNPAGEASVTPGSQSSAPDGGGGGGGGGGSASLGDDLAGAKAEDNSDADIKTTKVSGNYKAGGKSGFQAVKGGSNGDDANPFASMFDDKGEAGGIEEDRSIASDGGEDSGLFQKISKKYGQIQQDKRLDSQNLE